MEIKQFTFNDLAENTYILYDSVSKEAIVIDPGCYYRNEQEQLQNFITDQQLIVKKLINTHCHIDHILGNYFIKSLYNIELGIPSKEEEILQSAPVFAPAFGIMSYEPANADYYINENDEIKVGNDYLKVLFVPGHAPGHVAFYSETHHFIISGDVLFNGGIGRYDLPGCNYNDLMHSLKEVMMQLPDHTVVYPGHGPDTTIGKERKSNPFLN